MGQSSKTRTVELLDQSGEFIRMRLGGRAVPSVGVILGSGLGRLAEELDRAVAIPYGEIPHFPVSTVQGHAGRLVVGDLNGTPIVALQGRFHLYEGYSALEVVFPIRALARAGVKAFVITNAAGGVNKAFKAGDLMVIADHLNLTGQNPLAGPHDDRLGPRFPDMSEAYAIPFRGMAHEAAKEVGLSLKEGVYCVLSGPSYETPAEVRMLHQCGADAVGMSTIPEVVACRQMGVRVLGISLISNLAAGISKVPLTHAEVMETGERVAADFVRLIKAVVPKISRASQPIS
jgi:purine-nucleoside phosphorylase